MERREERVERGQSSLKNWKRGEKKTEKSTYRLREHILETNVHISLLTLF